MSVDRGLRSTGLRLHPGIEVKGNVSSAEFVRLSAQGATIPSRLAAYRESPHYHPYWSPRVMQVRWTPDPARIPAVRLNDVLEFDLVEGWAIQSVTDPTTGAEVLVAGVALERRREGKIEVDFLPPEGP